MIRKLPNSLDYKLHPEAFKLMKEAASKVIGNLERENKPYMLMERAFATLFLYARRIGSDKEHVEYLSKALQIDTLGLTDLLGAIDKYQKELGL